MRRPSPDPSVTHEPHLRPPPLPNPAVDPVLPYASPDTPAPAPHQSVFDEPHLRPAPPPAANRPSPEPGESAFDEPSFSPLLLGGAAPADAPTYARWLAANAARVGPARSWLLTLAIALAAGPCAVVGAFWGSGQSYSSLLSLVVFAPVVEELMKVALPTYLVEKRPYLFRSRPQILFAGLAGGLAFATLENLLYLHVYLDDPSPGLIAWRWTVCTALHTTCSTLAATGLARAWRDGIRRVAPPKMSLAAPWLTAAMLLHGVYNALALMLDLTKYQF